MNTTEIVNRLWNLCHILRDDGVNYHEYVTELTFLLFLKMSQETGRDKELPSGHRWSDLKKRDGIDQLDFYKKQLVHLGLEEAQGGAPKSLKPEKPRVLVDLRYRPPHGENFSGEQNNTAKTGITEAEDLAAAGGCPGSADG